MYATNGPPPASPIREARRRRRLTQAQAAADLGFSVGYYALVEREPRLLTGRMAERLFAAWNLNLAEPEPQR